jgi:hypothetical protein
MHAAITTAWDSLLEHRHNSVGGGARSRVGMATCHDCRVDVGKVHNLVQRQLRPTAATDDIGSHFLRV